MVLKNIFKQSEITKSIQNIQWLSIKTYIHYILYISFIIYIHVFSRQRKIPSFSRFS